MEQQSRKYQRLPDAVETADRRLGTNHRPASLETGIRRKELNSKSNDLSDFGKLGVGALGWVLGVVCG